MRRVISAIVLLALLTGVCAKEFEQTPAVHEPIREAPPQCSEVSIHAHVTAYTSSADECGNDLGITASGEPASDGVVACNFLPYGTRIKIPALFGDKEFVVKDRMAKRKSDFVDVWVESKETAFRIGKSFLTVVIVG